MILPMVEVRQGKNIIAERDIEKSIGDQFTQINVVSHDPQYWVKSDFSHL